MMDFDQFMSTLYIALDAVKNGDIDEAQIVREWSDHEEETTEGFQVILSRDVASRHELETLDEVLSKAARRPKVD
jgi:hypothetical protein